ncbi:MAG: hypothetical protein CVT92_08980 [Bacteroidetes bacterium HGW-Bacteroidetes-1]|jgi:uncharacterized membrane protein YhiD involved in acid resistance|nr:MAG: hypothetical protein CVT92_08980 [Bacteroidetes bacterium HGW-Bacteroidetes-1]
MFEEFQNFDLFPVTIYTVIGNLIVSFLCGMTISIVYRFVYKGPSYSVTFVNSLVILSMITSVVILVIGNNLARAFGLVGAMSIIRFRTAVRDVQDIVFIFFALSVGMAAGVGLYSVAISATLLISLVIILLSISNFGQVKKREFLLQMTYHNNTENELLIDAVLKKHCRKMKLVNLKNAGSDHVIEAHYHISLKQEKKNSLFVADLLASSAVIDVNLYFDEDDVSPPTY